MSQPLDCTDMQARLDDLVDGALDDATRTETERHMQACAACRRHAEGLRSLLQEAASLPRSMAPARDLWPDIRGRIEDGKVLSGRFAPGSAASPWRNRALLTAAALALVVASSGITAVFLRTGAPASTAARSPGTVAAAVAWEEFTAAEQEYVRVTDELYEALEARRPELAPETVQVVEENLEMIDRAIRESRAALERDPANAGLANTLTDIYRKKADFLRAMSRI